MRLIIETFNLSEVERVMCVEALVTAGSIVDAAALLGLTRHALKRRIIKHRIEWPMRANPGVADVTTASAAVTSAPSGE